MEQKAGDGAAGVRFCVDELHAKRIAHGVLAVTDAELVAHLAEQRVCLDVCPSSNYLLSSIPAIADHPIKQLMDAGVPCTINSDDPLLFGSSLVQEYELCRKELGMNDDALAACARCSFQHSHAPVAVKEAGLAGIEAWLETSKASTAREGGEETGGETGGGSVGEGGAGGADGESKD